MSSTSMVRAPSADLVAGGGEGDALWTPERVALIKRTIAKDSTDDELSLFVNTAKRLRLDPFARQIYAVKRRDGDDSGQKTMTIQVSIDGLRLIAERTERYLPSPELPVHQRNSDGELLATTVYVLKWHPNDSTWHKVPAQALFDEYAGVFWKNGERQLTKMWREKPYLMLAKCAEALAIRKAFPHETSGAYIAEEMGGGDVIDVEAESAPPKMTAPPPQPAAKPPAKAPTTSAPPAVTTRPDGSAPGPAVLEREAELKKELERAKAEREAEVRAVAAGEPKPNSPEDVGARPPAPPSTPPPTDRRQPVDVPRTPAQQAEMGETRRAITESAARAPASNEPAWSGDDEIRPMDREKILSRMAAATTRAGVEEVWPIVQKLNRAGLLTPDELALCKFEYTSEMARIKAGLPPGQYPEPKA